MSRIAPDLFHASVGPILFEKERRRPEALNASCQGRGLTHLAVFIGLVPAVG